MENLNVFDNLNVFIIIGVALFVFFAYRSRRELKPDESSSASFRQPNKPVGSPPPLNTLDLDTLDLDTRNRIAQFVQNNQKIEAIKLYREVTRVGLKEAKDAVEAFEKSGVFPPVAKPETVPVDLETVRALVREGKTIDAIKLYRQLTGVGLKEAKDAIDAMLDAMSGSPFR